MQVIRVPAWIIAATLTCSVPKAMAFGGVETGSGIASVHANATPIIVGGTDSSPSPRMMGMIKFAVAVLLMRLDIRQATQPNMTIKVNSEIPSTGNKLTK